MIIGFFRTCEGFLHKKKEKTMSANEISEEFRLVGLVIFELVNCHGETEKVAKVARSLLGVSSPLLQRPQFRRRGPLLSRRRPLRPSSDRKAKNFITTWDLF